jgi:unsaturated rhamnogalacturonyl hydrolase
MPQIKHLQRLFPTLVTSAVFFAAFAARAETSPENFGGATPLEWSVRMADSQVDRTGDTLFYKGETGAKWDYTSGLLAHSLLQLDARLCGERYQPFVEKLIGSFIQPDGAIRRYNLADYNIDHVTPGKALLRLYGLTGEERYRKAAALLRNQLATHPRTSEGGFWHKKRYPSQMWLDGLYMGEPFYAEYAYRFDERASFDDIANQIVSVAKHTYDPKTGLFYHGWDEKKEQSWASKETGASPNFWGRAIGWYAMAIVDVLDYFPSDHPRRPEIIAIYNQLAQGILKYQDPATGLWYQVVDQGSRPGNYLEATASSMFVYSLAKAVNHGYLSADTTPAIRKAYAGLISQLVTTDANGHVNLNRCCEVAGLSTERNGSFDYYVGEKIVSNDLKGVGPFILAGIELEKLLAFEPTGWDTVPAILGRIHEPKFPDHDFIITDFGAPADGKTDCTAAIAKAIAACNKTGGGRVVVPKGLFVTAAIHLKSNVNLHLSEGATLQFSPDPAGYLPVVLTRWEGVECMSYSALIYAFGQENIAVTGKGTLDGGATAETWLAWNKKKSSGCALQLPARNKLFKMGDENVPVAARVFGTDSFLRPNFVQPYRCKNVLIEGVTIIRSPMWELNPVLCTNVIVRGVTIVSRGANNDGCDPESCRDVLIENTSFDTGDDCIALKSGRNNDARRLSMPTENVIIRNCIMKDGHGGVTVGSEISGDCRNVFVEDCKMDSPNLDRALRLKTNAVRGGILENIYMRNVEIGHVTDAVVSIDFRYEEGAKGDYLPTVRNIVVENVTSTSSPRVLSLVGFKNAPIRGLRLVNCTFNGVKDDDIVQHVEGLEKVNVKVDKKQWPSTARLPAFPILMPRTRSLLTIALLPMPDQAHATNPTNEQTTR